MASSGLLKRYNGSTWDELYPKTLGQNVYNSVGSTALLNGSDKIQSTFLPDYILGNLIYGGTFVPSTGVATLTDNAKAELGVSTATITFTTSNYATYQGFYFVASVSGTFSTITFAVGDWAVANSAGWVKIDNTDAMISVNGKTGIVGLTLETSGNQIALTTAGNEGTATATPITVPYASNATYIKVASSVSGTTGNYCFIGSTIYNGSSALTLTNSISGNAATATSATKATQDGAGRVITTTYLPLAGGAINGNLSVSGTITEGGTLLSNKYSPLAGSSSLTTFGIGGTLYTFGTMAKETATDYGKLAGGTLASHQIWSGYNEFNNLYFQSQGGYTTNLRGDDSLVNDVTIYLPDEYNGVLATRNYVNTNSNKIFYGTSTPTGMRTNDLWFVTT